MQITHKEARRLIRSRLDDGIHPNNEKILGEHIRDCSKCRDYFVSTRETEKMLHQTLQRKWNIKPPPLQMELILGSLNTKRSMSALLVTRKAVVGMALLLFVFMTWHSMTNGSGTVQNEPLNMVTLVPTPATQYTATNTLQNGCQEIEYHIQPGDTLPGIAQYFSISKESILLANHLTSESLASIQKLIIPTCGSLPTQTIRPPIFTITPILNVTSTTPG